MSGLGLPGTSIDELPIEQRRQVLLDLARLDDPILSMIGGEPGDSPVYVVDTVFDLAAGTEDESLKAYARSSSLDVADPIEVRADPQSVHWEVQMSTFGSSPTVLAIGHTRDEALVRMRQALRDLCGDRVVEIKAWAEVQNAGSLEELVLAPTVVAKKVLSAFVTCERVELLPLPLAKDIALLRADLRPRKLRRKISYTLLNEPQGLGSQSNGLLIRDWNISVLHDEGARYANHHDLIAALRLGLNIEDIQPWPCDTAHKFLLAAELRAIMRSRGYVEITDFDPSAMVYLRVSLPEFSSEVTGEDVKRHIPHKLQEKPVWPPRESEKQRVVIVLDRARLAFEEEPEWETVSIRSLQECTGRLWVETNGPTERKKKAPIKKPKRTKVKTPSN
ncbi:hypothetical protein Rfer_4336 (plasmid) [Rhodoferax ferrireducens T118]|uniref:Uncharacterized protein n=1 Tax=Albidiferax ferrireducens (strain ATCC BAA-621 / DSM 15236 / T118) TaxID=338969 RepID=Q21QC3_ALBFT|nr:hypothetical protein [Rhodoferax ferrireducens]ABD72022.1 hypothetical protein Rfer_4336 [Rhodoferax ferrireducens T118]